MHKEYECDHYKVIDRSILGLGDVIQEVTKICKLATIGEKKEIKCGGCKEKCDFNLFVTEENIQN